MPKLWDQNRAEKVKELRDNGMSMNDIAAHFGVSRQTIHADLTRPNKAYNKAVGQLREDTATFIESLVDVLIVAHGMLKGPKK